MTQDVRRFIAEGIHSTVYAVRTQEDDQPPSWHAVKVIDIGRGHLPPHDVRTEVEVLRRVKGANLVSLVDYRVADGTHQLTFPLYTHTLRDLLDNPYFCPILPDIITSAYDPLQACSNRRAAFDGLSLGLASQLDNAVACLHAQGISHRDIKPSNVLVSKPGVVKLCDFGTAADVGRNEARTCQVGSGTYRAPELLFGDTSYDPLAIDLWALGATLAEFWTPFQRGTSTSCGVDVDMLLDDAVDRCLPSHYERQSDESDEEEFLMPALVRRIIWRRQSLFDNTHGEIGLAWSQMRVRGSPNSKNWPEFETLTDAGKLGFAHAPGVDLGRLLPMLAAPSDVLVVLEGLLQYSPSRRSSAAQILRRDQWQQALNNPESSIVMAGFKYQGIKEGL